VLALRLPTSHRKRMRLLRWSIAIAVVAGITLLVIFDRNSGHSLATPVDESKHAVVITTPKNVKPTKAAQAAAEATLRVFVHSAFVRRNLARSWPLATPHMKVGTSRADWLAGNLPVVPYPAAAFRGYGATLKYSWPGVQGYDVLIVPKQTPLGKHAGEQIYQCELHHVHGRWLVDFCYPRKTL
jgi:hypothetical protein